jgi:hypothetical protein
VGDRIGGRGDFCGDLRLTLNVEAAVLGPVAGGTVLAIKGSAGRISGEFCRISTYSSQEAQQAYRWAVGNNPAVEVTLSPDHFPKSGNPIFTGHLLSKLLENIVAAHLARVNELGDSHSGAIDFHILRRVSQSPRRCNGRGTYSLQNRLHIFPHRAGYTTPTMSQIFPVIYGEVEQADNMLKICEHLTVSIGGLYFEPSTCGGDPDRNRIPTNGHVVNFLQLN